MAYNQENLWYSQKHLWVSLPLPKDVRTLLEKSKRGGRGNKKISAEETEEKVSSGIMQLEPQQRIAVVGATELMCEKLGEIDSLELPNVGEDLDIGGRCVHVHLHNVIRYLSSPLTGTIVEINEALLDDPNIIHLNPYEHWLFKILIDEPEEIQMLQSYDQYNEFLDNNY